LSLGREKRCITKAFPAKGGEARNLGPNRKTLVPGGSRGPTLNECREKSGGGLKPAKKLGHHCIRKRGEKNQNRITPRKRNHKPKTT